MNNQNYKGDEKDTDVSSGGSSRGGGKEIPDGEKVCLCHIYMYL
jgi:hypothetical protein